MAITTMTTFSERWLDEVVLNGAINDTLGSGDVNESFRAPAGLGDVAIMELEVIGQTLATPLALTGAQGVRVDVLSPDGASQVDILGTWQWYMERSDTMSARVSPDPLVLWRAGELLRVLSQELDTNAAPTGDLRVNVKVVRVRPMESPAQPVQLVR